VRGTSRVQCRSSSREDCLIAAAGESPEDGGNSQNGLIPHSLRYSRTDAVVTNLKITHNYFKLEGYRALSTNHF
jgi:hypothetical protein